MNNRISEKDLIRIKGEFQSKYGIEMDDWSAMLMADSQERFQGKAGSPQKKRRFLL